MSWYLKKIYSNTFVLPHLPLIESISCMDEAAFGCLFFFWRLFYLRHLSGNNTQKKQISSKNRHRGSKVQKQRQVSAFICSSSSSSPASSSSGGANFSFQRASPRSISQQPRAKISEKRELTATLRSSSSCLQPRTRRWKRCTSWSADHTSMWSCQTKLLTSHGPFAQILVSL